MWSFQIRKKMLLRNLLWVLKRRTLLKILYPSKHQRRSVKDNLETKYQVILCQLYVQNVEKDLLEMTFCWHISDIHMKVLSILVISVIIKLQLRVVFSNILSLNMKVSSTRVIIVII